ncbi:MAG: hydroxymethylglutaryl-CoA synthase family protein [Promethearchaeota archaeon]|nr:MAG: hydroxymethylglutaryl-CoA synthase family protein [Candidatus Lokiarchaeota archaeon]
MLSNEYLFTNIGIDSFGFHAPRFYVDLSELADLRKVDPNKYRKGLLCKEMRLPEIGEDIISIGLKAAHYALLKGKISPKQIDAIFVGTETMTYAVKSVSNIFAQLLGISQNSITQDIYNACAGGTLALLNAIALVEKEIIKKALVISCDISSYDIGSPSEPTQGSGAIAFVISKNPRVAVFGKSFGKVSANVNDFWRPANQKNAQVFGQYSLDTYMNFQIKAYDDLISQIGDFHADYYTFHAPFAKLPLKIMQQIILKRWSRHINYLPKLRKKKDGTSLLRKLDNFLHDVTVLPEYIYLKLKERGYSSERLEDMSHSFISNIKGKVLPQLRVPSNFGNMYNASLWAQIIYILENYGRVNDTLYFGSYGSGATCISGLLKVRPRFETVVKKGPKVSDYIDINKERRTIKEYELVKQGLLKPHFNLGHIMEHKKNHGRGFVLHFCDKGCLIPDIEGINRCPKGHTGFHTRFFPLYAVLDSNPIEEYHSSDLSYLADGLVRIAPNLHKGANLEYEIRRADIEGKDESLCEPVGLIDWAPVYYPTKIIY